MMMMMMMMMMVVVTEMIVDTLSLFRCHTNFLLLPIDLCLGVAILSKKLCLCMASLLERTRLAVHKQSFLSLLRQNGRCVREVYCMLTTTL